MSKYGKADYQASLVGSPEPQIIETLADLEVYLKAHGLRLTVESVMPKSSLWTASLWRGICEVGIGENDNVAKAIALAIADYESGKDA